MFLQLGLVLPFMSVHVQLEPQVTAGYTDLSLL